MIKQPYTFSDAGGKINGTAATLDSTTDAIEFKTNTFWSLNCALPSLAVTGSDPTITIEVSNTNVGADFNPLEGALLVDLPDFFEGEFSTWKFFRLVYASNGATAGTKEFTLVQEV